MGLRIDKYMPPSLEHLIYGGGVYNGLIGGRCKVIYREGAPILNNQNLTIVNYDDAYIYLYEHNGGILQPDTEIVGICRYSYGSRSAQFCLWELQDNITKNNCQMDHSSAQRIVDLLPESWQTQFTFGINYHYYALPYQFNQQE